ncbi:MAG: hypothetical protein ACI837_001465 [Crocinitomicaceae bacterium]|jgi:hypothetical protein
MMKYSRTLIFLLAFTQFNVNAQDTWTPLQNVNGAPKSACVGFGLNGTGYIGLGLDENFERRQLYAYDVPSDDWSNEEAIGNAVGLGLERCAAVSFPIGNFAYVGTGSSTGNPYFVDFWQYDPATDSWAQMANFDGSARRHAIGFAISGKGYVGTGVDENENYKKDFWEYNPGTNTWFQLGDFGGSARQSAVGFSMGSKGYLITGDDGVPTSDFWEYDPILDQWTQKPDFAGSSRAGAVGFGIYPQIVLATGYDINLNYMDDVWEFNIDSNIWVQRNDFPGDARTTAVAFEMNGLGYLGTGYNDDYLDDFWSYEASHICITDTSITYTDACASDGYTWLDGDGNTYNPVDGTGPWYFTLPAQSFVGCDSVTTLYLNWISPDTTIVSANECANVGYSWIDGNTYTPLDGAGPWYYTDPGASVDGCDSTSKLNINWYALPDTSITSLNECATGYQWIDGNTYLPVDGNGPWYHTIVGGSVNGCDSVASLFLNWYSVPDTSVNMIDACENTGYQWIDGNTYFPVDGTGPWYHTLTGASVTGCDSTTSLNINWQSIANMTVTNDGVTLTSDAAASNTFQWVNCPGYTLIPGETGQSFTPTVTGEYAVIVNDGICVDTSACILFTDISGLDEYAIFDGINIYPNPIEEVINISLGGLSGVFLKVYTVTGQIVYASEEISTPNYQFRLNNAAGVYTIAIESEGLIKHYRLIKK